ncbi:hypothetical protein Cni_G00749 [Canna indica]|uniref:Uncharacterized protein n=1 Tax=Canna indica TaxID=4628 RepID=A0AAQ3JLJ0_9LILI|nr:hypothetical protein Cni_G00749 [Canna indica]
MVMMGQQQLERLVGGLKSKLMKMRSFKGKSNTSKPYDKMDKTDSMRVEIKSRRAKKLIAKNLKMADSVANKGYML